ncbi:MAG TPA: M20/M25/M40 family metallo-hydrolase, partial [Clostridia bacterium]|nr:M20/M25/M40 family metallo-hydrolase [Clostridia bacterium]
LGEGGYHIGLMADMDALLVPDECGVPQPFHSCGHSVQVAVMLTVMRALKNSHLLDEMPGRVSLFLTPAEEFIDLEFRRNLIRSGGIRYCSGKQNIAASGLLDDVDCVLSCHVMGGKAHAFDVNSTLAGFTVKKVTFRGKAAHSGVAPHEGRNALHAAVLFLQACAFIKDQFPPEAGIRLEPILTEGGISMNVVPETAVVETYLRANTMDDLAILQDKFDAASHHSAGAIGVGAKIDNTIGYVPLRQSPELTDVVYRNMRLFYDEGAIARDVVSGASGDIGDIARFLPTVQFGFSGMEGRVHSGDFSIHDPEHAYMDTAKVLLGTVADLLLNRELQVRNPNVLKDRAWYLKEWLKA